VAADATQCVSGWRRARRGRGARHWGVRKSEATELFLFSWKAGKSACALGIAAHWFSLLPLHFFALRRGRRDRVEGTGGEDDGGRCRYVDIWWMVSQAGWGVGARARTCAAASWRAAAAMYARVACMVGGWRLMVDGEDGGVAAPVAVRAQ
jgi:hypothetical protein